MHVGRDAGAHVGARTGAPEPACWGCAVWLSPALPSGPRWIWVLRGAPSCWPGSGWDGWGWGRVEQEPNQTEAWSLGSQCSAIPRGPAIRRGPIFSSVKGRGVQWGETPKAHPSWYREEGTRRRGRCLGNKMLPHLPPGPGLILLALIHPGRLWVRCQWGLPQAAEGEQF